MIRNLYLIVVVTFRSLGLVCTGTAILAFFAGSVVTQSIVGGLRPLIAFAPALIGGLALWFLAKPFAAIATRGLE